MMQPENTAGPQTPVQQPQPPMPPAGPGPAQYPGGPPLSLPYIPPQPSPHQLWKQDLRGKMFNMRGLALSLFAFAFCYLYSEWVLARGSSGVGVTLSILVFCAFTFYMLYYKAETRNRAALLVYVPIGIIALGFALHYNPMSHAAMTLTLFTLLVLQLVMLTNPGQKELFSTQMIKQVCDRVVAKPFYFWGSTFTSFKLFKNIRSKAMKRVLLVLLGLLVALPACALLLMWFTSADAAFADGYTRVVEALRNIIEPKWGKIFLNLFLVLLLGMPLGAILLYNANAPGQPEHERQAPKGVISTVVIATFSFCIAAVMVLFVVTQFRYFFFGASNGAITQIGYAEYARRGFFELTYASAFIFVIVAAVIALCRRRETGKLPAAIKTMLGVICLSNIVILVSAVSRMSLYIEVHGYSIKRLMTLWMMPVLGVCTLLLVVKCLKDDFKALKCIGYAVVVAVCLLSIFNTDRFVAAQRVDRYLETGVYEDLDTAYFHQLSYSCLPEVERLLAQIDPPEFEDLRQKRAYFYYQIEEYPNYNELGGFTFDRLAFTPDPLPAQ